MSDLFPCPYLSAPVELTDEGAEHIASQHPDLLPEHLDLVAATLADPDLVRRSVQLSSARLFSRWYHDLRTGRFVVVVVVTDISPTRHWIVTAYSARRIAGGATEWSRS